MLPCGRDLAIFRPSNTQLNLIVSSQRATRDYTRALSVFIFAVVRVCNRMCSALCSYVCVCVRAIRVWTGQQTLRNRRPATFCRRSSVRNLAVCGRLTTAPPSSCLRECVRVCVWVTLAVPLCVCVCAWEFVIRPAPNSNRKKWALPNANRCWRWSWSTIAGSSCACSCCPPPSCTICSSTRAMWSSSGWTARRGATTRKSSTFSSRWVTYMDEDGWIDDDVI